MIERVLASAVIALAFVITLALFAPVRGQEHSPDHAQQHSQHHQLYNGLMRPDMPTSSCCNNNDCAPVEAKWDAATRQWSAVKPGVGWVVIPPNKIVPRDRVPDGLGAQAHLCAPPPSWPAFAETPKMIFCFIEPGGGT